MLADDLHLLCASGDSYQQIQMQASSFADVTQPAHRHLLQVCIQMRCCVLAYLCLKRELQGTSSALEHEID